MAISYPVHTSNALMANCRRCSKLVVAFCLVKISSREGYSFFDAITNTSRWFFAAPRIMLGPPISIFSIINDSSFVAATVSSKGYRSTITKSISGILYCFISATSVSTSLLPKIPPNTDGCSVLTLPPKMEG